MVLRELLLALVRAGVVLLLILTVGQKLVRGWFTLVARQKSSELFVINVLMITLGLAWLTNLAGLSLALGVFLAGMLISETQYGYQVEEDIKPFRDVLSGCFSSRSAPGSMSACCSATGTGWCCCSSCCWRARRRLSSD